jgi:hypothetical protein
MRGVLGCSEPGVLPPTGFLPVYFRGEGDLYDEAGLLPDAALALAVDRGPDAGSFGVLCTPVIWVGDSTLNSSSSSSSPCPAAPVTVLSS